MRKFIGIQFVKYMFFVVMLSAVMMFNVQSSFKTSANTVLTDKKYLGNLSSLTVENELASVTAIKKETASVITKEIETEPIAAMWVDGKSVPMTDEQVEEFEKKLYSCKTFEEYDALVRSLSYYNKGVDMSRFSWYWDDLENLYSDKQISILKNSKIEDRVMPNVIGMKAQEAYDFMIGMGLVGRMVYSYDPNCKLPVGYCYWQDMDAGSPCRTNAGSMIYIQAPKELLNTPVDWDPDDKDFDIYQYAQNIRENERYTIIMPNVVGLYRDEAKRQLEEAGFKKVTITYLHVSDDIAPGYCYEQSWAKGTMIYNTTEITIGAQVLPADKIDIPNVVGMQVLDALDVLHITGLEISCHYLDDPESGVAEGCCIRQDYTLGEGIGRSFINLYIQKASAESVSNSESVSVSAPVAVSN